MPILSQSPSPYSIGSSRPRGPQARADHIARIRQLADEHDLWELVQQAAFYSGEPDELSDLAVWLLLDRMNTAVECRRAGRTAEWLHRPVF